MYQTLADDPAFPQIDINGTYDVSGLTIRQEFAARFMEGILASNALFVPEIIADTAVNMADALIARLNKDTNQ